MEQRMRGDCPKCKADLVFFTQENQDKVIYTCPECNEKIKIKIFTYLNIVDQFIEFFKKKKNIKLTDNDVIQAKEWISTITNYKGEIKDDDRLIYLLSFSNNYDRLKKTISRIKSQIQANLLPRWKSYYNFIFMTISEEISLITLVSNQLFKKIEQIHKVKLTNENKKEEFMVFLQQLNSLFHIIFSQLSENMSQEEVEYLKFKIPFFLYIFSVFDKLNKIFKILIYDFPMDHGGATSKLFDFDKNGTLAEYKRIRNSIAHFHILIEDKRLMKFKILDYYNTKEKDIETGNDIWKFELIENPHEIFEEMIILVLIIYVLLGSYQLYWQSEPENVEK
ncbi:MAG: zf-TFIIB domain-containing protein [Candidatus Hodarchaeota archaeon]